MLTGDVMEKGKTRLPIALIGALIVVMDDINTLRGSRDANAPLKPDLRLYSIVSTLCNVWLLLLSYSIIAPTIFIFLKLTWTSTSRRQIAIPDPAVGMHPSIYEVGQLPPHSTPKINIVLSKFQNVSTCRASLEAEQSKGRNYLAAQRTPRESILISQLHGVDNPCTALR